jgi:glycosyltransferase involved in cell wall biosynthesis
MNSDAKQTRVWFCLANPAGYSGQKAATLLLRDGLARRRWHCSTLSQPVLDRGTRGRIGRLCAYFADLLGAWGRALRGLSSGDLLHLSLGQTRASLLRDGVPLLIAASRSVPTVVALNGGLFMQWADDSLEARWFRAWGRRAARIVVVGEKQRRQIDRWLGVGRAVVIPNTCEPGIARPPRATGGRVHVLFLSSLIDTKGYPQVLEAVARLAEEDRVEIDLTLCGRHTPSEFARELNDRAGAAHFIAAAVERIARTPRGRALWIEGADGVAKQRLFAAADIFMLPTDYAVEAQPLVLLEAMAAGCAIVTSRAGEIETLLDHQTAVLLDDVSVAAVNQALTSLAADPERRAALGAAAKQRFEQSFSPDVHLDRWERLFQSILLPPEGKA